MCINTDDKCLQLRRVLPGVCMEKEVERKQVGEITSGYNIMFRLDQSP